MSGSVNVERRGTIAFVTIDHAPVNTLTAETAAALGAHATALDESPEIRAVVVTGAGEKAFAAGADVRGFVGVDDEAARKQLAKFRSMIRAVLRSKTPWIAAIHGFCLGGGLELSLACDFRIAAEDAVFGLPEVTLGLLPGAGGTQLLPRVLGARRARLLYLTGRTIDVRRAYEWGLVEEVVTRDELLPAAEELALQLAAQSGHAIGVLKEIAHETGDLSIEDGLSVEADGFLRCLLSRDGQEGVAAFLERRQPRWQHT